MNHEEITRYCLAKPGAVPDEPWEGDQVAKVGGKIFAFLGGGRVGVKCGATAEEAAEWRQRYPDTVSVMPYAPSPAEPAGTKFPHFFSAGQPSLPETVGARGENGCVTIDPVHRPLHDPLRQ